MIAVLPYDIARCLGTTDTACSNCARRVRPGNGTPLRQQLIAPAIKPDARWADRTEDHDQ